MRGGRSGRSGTRLEGEREGERDNDRGLLLFRSGKAVNLSPAESFSGDAEDQRRGQLNPELPPP